MKKLWAILFLAMFVIRASPALAVEEFKPLATLQNAAGATSDGTELDVALYNTVSVGVTISATATVTFETTVDGSTWGSVACTQTSSTSGALSATATATGAYQCPVAGMAKFRARISSFGSGTVTVKARATTALMSKKGGGAGGGLASTDIDTCAEFAAIMGGETGTCGSVVLSNSPTLVTPDLGTPSAVVLTNATGTAASLTAGTATVANSGDSATSFFSSGTIEDARLPSSMASKSITGSLNIPNSTSLPGTCTVGDIYMDTDATSGQRLYACQSTNTWALQGDGGGGGGSVATDTIWDAAGDLAVGTGADTAAKLAKGTALQVLRVNAGATALEWADPTSSSGLTHPQVMARASIGF